MIGKIVNILGIVCLLLVVAAGGVAGYLAAKGTLTGESLKTAVAAVTSQPAEAAAEPLAAADSQPETQPYAGVVGEIAAPDAAALARLEMMRRELGNEQALVEAARVHLQRQQEQFEQERKAWSASREKDAAGDQRAGEQKEMEYLSSIKPGQALELLRGKPEGQAARILMAMETRKGKKVIEMCKSSDEKEWVKRILELIRQQSNVQAQALTGG